MQGMNAREYMQWSDADDADADADDGLLMMLMDLVYIEDGIKVDISVSKVAIPLLLG
jgi:hypothetical protein